MSRPIILWKPRNTIESDEACTTIVKYSLPPAPRPGPYDPVESISRNAFTYVQSLRQLCIRRLAEFPDQVHLLGSARVHYRTPESEEEFDLVRALTPGYSHDAPTSSAFLARVDPRLWGTMVQAIAPLPPAFRMYTLPLSDVHMPLLQRIPSTPDFSLITVLELYGQRDLDDETVIQLGELHTLTALDVGMTTLTPWGIRTLSRTLAVSEDGGTRMGPWGLRILSLRNCMKITDKVFEYLSGFPLLSVIFAERVA
ncbi:hypothetical protein K474DRAFT_12182 [Panus rudis PR-1116 ss-1]|nr:hypothetical protein K474DRAFT_12182 [Panus rudis PR-1116 ss-1]